MSKLHEPTITTPKERVPFFRRRTTQLIGSALTGSLVFMFASAQTQETGNKKESAPVEHHTAFGEIATQQVDQLAAKKINGIDATLFEWGTYPYSKLNPTGTYNNKVRKPTLAAMLGEGEKPTPQDKAVEACFNAAVQLDTRNSLAGVDGSEFDPGKIRPTSRLKAALEDYREGNFADAASTCGTIGATMVQKWVAKASSPEREVCGDVCADDKIYIFTTSLAAAVASTS